MILSCLICVPVASRCFLYLSCPVTLNVRLVSRGLLNKTKGIFLSNITQFCVENSPTGLNFSLQPSAVAGPVLEQLSCFSSEVEAAGQEVTSVYSPPKTR